MSDDELVGLLMSFAKCDRPLETTVKNIRDRFGTCSRAFMATYDELLAVNGVTRSGAVLILLVACMARRKYPGDYIGKRVVDYAEMFYSIMRNHFDEQLWAAVILEDGRLAAVECLAVGTAVTVNVNISRLVRLATMHDCAQIVIAHSHPVGASAEASFDDVASIERIDSEVKDFGVRVIGHVIVSGKDARYYKFG